MTGRVPLQPDEPKIVQILVVEDERVIARDIKACLENLGYAVPAIASSGVEAIEKAKALHPDMVLMDIRLEGEMDGIQAAQQIWQDLHIPVIYSTGHSDHATVERAMATEPFGYILKPIKEQDLYVTLKTALKRYQSESRTVDPSFVNPATLATASPLEFPDGPLSWILTSTLSALQWKHSPMLKSASWVAWSALKPPEKWGKVLCCFASGTMPHAYAIQVLRLTFKKPIPPVLKV